MLKDNKSKLEKYLEDLENKLEEKERKIKTIQHETEVLDKEVSHFFSEHQITEEIISQYVSNAKNFSQENWEVILAEKKRLDEKLACQLNALAHPMKTKRERERYKNITPHWIFVR